MKLPTLKKVLRGSTLLATSFTCLFATSTFANVITLDAIPVDFRDQNLPYFTEGDFNIAASCTNCLNVFSTVEVLRHGDTSAAAGWGASGRYLETWNTNVIFTLTETSGSAFNFLGFDIGWYNNESSNADWSVRTYDNLGAIIADDDYKGTGHFAFSYENVYAIEFQNNGGFSSFDNLRASVPVPGSLALLTLGLAGLGFSRKARR